MHYKTKHSESDEFVVYRKFSYGANRKLGMRGFLSVVLLSVGIFILIPAPEEILIYGVLAPVFNRLLGISTQQGVALAMAIYKGLGLIFLIAAVIVGGPYLKIKLKTRMYGAVEKLKRKR